MRYSLSEIEEELTEVLNKYEGWPLTEETLSYMREEMRSWVDSKLVSGNVLVSITHPEQETTHFTIHLERENNSVRGWVEDTINKNILTLKEL